MSQVLAPWKLIVLILLLVVGCAPAASTTATPTPGVSAPAKPAASTAPSQAAAVSASPSTSPSASSGASPATVQLTDALKFEPATLTVARGSTVTWRNASQAAHTVTDDPSKAANASDAQLPPGTQPWDSGNLNPGQTFTHTFDAPGTYKYFCQPHEAAGMVATIVVTP